MSVMELGSDSNVEEVTIEADNWMTALRLGRTSMGESGGVPTGSSCAVAADGRVTILDPIDRRRFVLQMDKSASYHPPAPAAGMKIPSDPVPPPAAVPSAAPAKVPSPLSPASSPVANAPASPAPASSPAPAPSSPAQAPAPKRKRARTMAYIPDAPKAPKATAIKPTPAYQPPTPEALQQAALTQASGQQSERPSEPSAEEQPPPQTSPSDISGLEATVAVSAADLNLDAPHPKAGNAIIAAEAQAKAEAKAEEALEAAAKAELEAKEKAEAEAQARADAEAARIEQEAAENAAKLPNDDDTGQVGGVSWRVLHRRDSNPSDTSPLTYRERSYAIDAGASEADAEAVAIARAVSLMNLLADGPKGRFINVAVFDHVWTEQPSAPPVVTIAEKDWLDERTVEYPLRSARQSAAPPPRKRATTNDQDRRLSDAFEACQDLLFVASPLEGVEFCHRLLGDLIPCGAITACLYDIDDNVHRVVAVSGPGGEKRRGHAIPHNAGLFGAVTASGRPLLIQANDERFDLEHEGREGLQIDNGLYLASVHNGRHLATIQMLNRQGSEFSAADADLGYYIAQQLAEFLAKARGSLRSGA